MDKITTYQTIGAGLAFPFYVRYKFHNINIPQIDVYYDIDPFRDKSLDNPLSYIYLN